MLIPGGGIDMGVTWRMRRKIPQRGFLIRRDTCDSGVSLGAKGGRGRGTNFHSGEIYPEVSEYRRVGGKDHK